MNGKSHLSKIGPLNLLFPLPPPPTPHNSGGEDCKLRITDDGRDEPKKREVLAYKVELMSKIVYPVLFGFFNLCYWSYYLHYYAISQHLFSV